MVQDRRRSDYRMACKGQFVEQIEDPGANSARLVGGPQKDRFEMPHLLSDPQHLFCSQARGVGKDRHTVAAERNSAENVDMTVGEIHRIPRHSSDLRDWVKC